MAKKKKEWEKIKSSKGYNWVNDKNEFLSPIWFSAVGKLGKQEWTLVENKRKGCNYINTKGEFLSDTWYCNAYEFHEGYAVVNLDGSNKCYYIDEKGNIAFPNLPKLTYCSNFENGFGIVRTVRGCNVINEKGEFISNDCFQDVQLISLNDIVMFKVERHFGYNIMDVNGDIKCDDWYKEIRQYKNVFIVNDKGLERPIDVDGKFLFPYWYKRTYSRYYEEYESNKIEVEDKGINFIDDKDYSLKFDTWFKTYKEVFNHRNDEDGHAYVVEIEPSKYNYINDKGEKMFDYNFDEIRFAAMGVQFVRVNDKWNILCSCNISEEWYDTFEAAYKVMHDNWYIRGYDETLPKKEDI